MVEIAQIECGKLLLDVDKLLLLAAASVCVGVVVISFLQLGAGVLTMQYKKWRKKHRKPHDCDLE